MTKLEKIKEFLAKLGLLPLVKFFLKKPMELYYRFVFKRSSQQCLRLVHEAIKKSGIEVWLECGSYLGAKRNGRIIGHDLDIDFALKSSENLSLLHKELIVLGFKRERSIYLKGTNELVETTYSFNGAKVDFFQALSEGDYLVIYDFASEKGMTWGETIQKFGGLMAFKSYMTPFELGPVSLNGLTFLGASESFCDAHLRELYGESYNTPDKNWSLDMRPVRSRSNDVGVVVYG
jgi:hypothetical protein